MLLLVMMARLATSPGGRTAAFRLLGIAPLLLLEADIGDAVLDLVSSYEGGLIDAGWLLSYVAWGAAALHPRCGQCQRSLPTRRRGSPTGDCSCSHHLPDGPTVLAEQRVRHQPIDVDAVVLGSVVLFLLVVLAHGWIGGKGPGPGHPSWPRWPTMTG